MLQFRWKKSTDCEPKNWPPSFVLADYPPEPVLLVFLELRVRKRKFLDLVFDSESVVLLNDFYSGFHLRISALHESTDVIFTVPVFWQKISQF